MNSFSLCIFSFITIKVSNLKCNKIFYLFFFSKHLMNIYTHQREPWTILYCVGNSEVVAWSLFSRIFQSSWRNKTSTCMCENDTCLCIYGEEPCRIHCMTPGIITYVGTKESSNTFTPYFFISCLSQTPFQSGFCSYHSSKPNALRVCSLRHFLFH